MELLSLKQVGKELGVTGQAVRHHIKKRGLKGYLVGRSVWVVERYDLEEFKLRRRPPGRPKKRRRDAKALPDGKSAEKFRGYPSI
jgi:predicted ArsR family transcriptional regulator